MTTQTIITLAGIALTAFVTWSIAQRRIVVEHVTAERRKWRRKVRAKALEVHDAILSGCETRALRLQQEFRALLNPHDPADKEILHCITAGGGESCREARAEQFAVKISYLLKHDWDRAKLEAGFFLCRWTLRVNRYRGGMDDVAKTGFCQEWKDWRKKYTVRRWRSFLVAVALAVVLAGGLTAGGWLKFGTGEKSSPELFVVVVDRTV